MRPKPSSFLVPSVLALAFGAGLAAQALPPVPVPPQNPITPPKALLGKLLFWEEQLSSNNRVACGTCHTFAAGGGDLRRVLHPGADGTSPSPDDHFGSPGIPLFDANGDYVPHAAFGHSPQVGGRASPGFLVAAWFPELFWDGRASGAFVDPATGQTLIPTGGALETQSLQPLLATDEMAFPGRTFADVEQKLAAVRPLALASNLPADMANAIAGGTTYPDLFQAAFGTPDVTAQRIAYALATYQRTLVPNQTPYDQFVAGNPAALTMQQAMGLNVFNGPGRCNLCHTPGLFSDGTFRNLGLRPIAEDNGRQGVTGLAAHGGRFKVPSLRNAGLRTTFMHTGQFTSIPQVFGFYLNGGGPFPQNKDPQLVPLQVPPQAANALIDFVTNALTDPRVASGLPPFDRPTLRGQLLPETGTLYGVGTAGGGGRVPAMLAGVPANLGSQDFRLGVGDARGGAFTMLALSPTSANTLLNGVRVNVQLDGGTLLLPLLLSGPNGVANAGHGTLPIVVPADPGLAALVVRAQWFVWDAAVATGVASSRGAEVRLF